MFKKQVTYQAFCKAERPKIVASNPQLGFGDIVKMLGVAWSRLSVAEKLAYRGPGFRGRGAAAATAAPPPPPALPVAEAEGLRLHLSSSSATGYKGVSKERGVYGSRLRAVGEYTPPAHPSPAVAAEAEGLRLHLSSRSSTGYKGVYEVFKSGSRFQARHMADGRQVCYGTFDTAVEAAVAYAWAVGEAPGQAEVAAAAAAAAEPRAAQAQERARAVEAACGAARARCPVRDTSTTRPGHPPIGSQGDARRQG